MSVTLVDSGSMTRAGEVNSPFLVPSSAQVGDLIVLAVNSARSIVKPAGWTNAAVVSRQESSDTDLTVIVHYVQAGEPGTNARPFQLGGSTPYQVTAPWAIFRGVANGSVVVATDVADADSADTITLSTVIGDAAFVLVIGSHPIDTQLGSSWFTPPAGFTEIADVESLNGPKAATTSIAWKTQASPGSSGAIDYGASFVPNGNPADTSVKVILLGIQPADSAPAAPLLGTPANASTVDLDAGPTFTWTSDPDSDSTGWYFRRKLLGDPDYEYLDASDETWDASPVANAGDPDEYDFSVGSWDNGAVYNWSVATENAIGVGAFASDFTVTGGQPAVVNVTAPTGSVTDTDTPDITYTATDPEADPLQAYEAKVFTAAQYGAGGFDPDTATATWESGIVAATSVAPIPVTDSLANGVTFRAYVRVKTAGQWSDWDYSGFDIDVTPPEAPTFVVTPDPATASVTVTVTAGHDPVDWPDAAAELSVSDDGGTTWTVAATALYVGDEAVIVERGTPFHVNRQRRVRTLSEV